MLSIAKVSPLGAGASLFALCRQGHSLRLGHRRQDGHPGAPRKQGIVETWLAVAASICMCSSVAWAPGALSWIALRFQGGARRWHRVTVLPTFQVEDDAICVACSRHPDNEQRQDLCAWGCAQSRILAMHPLGEGGMLTLLLGGISAWVEACQAVCIPLALLCRPELLVASDIVRRHLERSVCWRPMSTWSFCTMPVTLNGRASTPLIHPPIS